MSLLDEFRQLSEEMAYIPLYLKEVTQEAILEQPLFFHLSKYPLLQCIDVYKFLYQGSCGWAHLSSLGDEKQIKDYLVKELTEAEKQLEIDEIFELLDNKTRLGRVNLRSWKEHVGMDSELLLNLMMKAQQNTPGTPELFIERWEEFKEWLQQGLITYPAGAKKSMNRWLDLIFEIAHETVLSSDLPLVSHSPMFKKSYNPTYRIIREEDIFQEKK